MTDRREPGPRLRAVRDDERRTPPRRAYDTPRGYGERPRRAYDEPRGYGDRPRRGYDDRRAAPSRSTQRTSTQRTSTQRTSTARPNPRTATRPALRRTPPRRPPVRRPVLQLGNPHRRLRVAFLAIAAVLSLFLGRLVQLQGFDGSAYAAEAESARLSKVPLPATRGTIYDTDGVALATTVSAFMVTADPSLLTTANHTSPERVAKALAPLLHVDEATLLDKLGRSTSRYEILARAVDPAVWSSIKELPDGDRVGIFGSKVGKRQYPNSAVAANVVGFVGREGGGLAGLEYSQNALLAGTDGEATYERSPTGQQLPLGANSTVAPVAGKDLTLTLDSDIQFEAQRALASQVKYAKAESGDVVVLDIKTGAVLAMATAPSFDANKAGTAHSENLKNRPIVDVFEPGSTSKIITMAATLEEGLATPTTPITVPNSIKRGGDTFHDDVDHKTWHLTLTGVLAKSSNIGTILASEKIHNATFYDYLRKFGFGQKTGLGLPGESRGILAQPKKWSDTTPYTVRFGQGVSVTTLQAASVFATIANDGVRVEPNILEQWTDADGTVHRAPAAASTRVVSAKTAQQVRTMMEAVVGEGGTAPMAQIPGYRVAGKTGTANRVVDGHYSGYTSSFIGLAPADKPRYVVAVVLQNPHNGHFGGRLAGPVFKDVMSFTLKSQGVPPTGGTSPKLKLTTD